MLKIIFLSLFFLITNCGIKGKPLPPVEVTAQESEKTMISAEKKPSPKENHK